MGYFDFTETPSLFEKTNQNGQLSRELLFTSDGQSDSEMSSNRMEHYVKNQICFLASHAIPILKILKDTGNYRWSGLHLSLGRLWTKFS